MINYFRSENRKSKRDIEIKVVSTILKTNDTFVKIAITSISLAKSFAGNGYKVIPIPNGIPCGLPFKKVFF